MTSSITRPGSDSGTDTSLFDRRPLTFDPQLKRNRLSGLFTLISGLFATLAVLPLVLVLVYVLVQGGRLISLRLFTELPPAPGLEGGGIGNAMLGTVLVTLIATLIALPVGVAGGVYLSEYAGWSASATMCWPGCPRSSAVCSSTA